MTRMRLYWLRHGTALSRAEWDGSDDLRPLSVDGASVVAAVAGRIAALDLKLDAIITSPYERALRTAVMVHEVLGEKTALVEEARLTPGQFTPASLAEILEAHADASAIMLVGHEPSMTDVLADVVGGGDFSLKKAGLVRVDLDSISPVGGVLKWFVPPRLLV